MQDKYRVFCALFETAECHIKAFEKLEFEPCIPAINQLRYAACHLKRSFQQDDPLKESECIKSAERHCQRAIKDVTEAAIDYVTTWVDEFEHGFMYVPISEEIPNHNELKTKLREAMDFVTSYNHDETEDATGRLEQYMKDVMAIQRCYEAGQDGLAKRVRIVRWKVLGAIFGMLLGLAGLVVHFCKP